MKYSNPRLQTQLHYLCPQNEKSGKVAKGRLRRFFGGWFGIISFFPSGKLVTMASKLQAVTMVGVI